ncbi:helix-turn-helix domain-containing protein [Parachitinimonas caeni]|uniref:Helix-turn-helix transcriptional regulator n=1 Tax=Parachitinimonas caeni TaxID=3031301 RepID=A0ABT7E0L8_9NEIS|nr:helix-turn-helix transcriptional regulator [Parachitinimonas caeni]MDK2124452.1 helix-turn-helix transcriptional regulator [Parachitinimonas caeni]
MGKRENVNPTSHIMGNVAALLYEIEPYKHRWASWLAERTGMTPHWMRKFLAGKASSLEVYYKVADALGVPIARLFDESLPNSRVITAKANIAGRVSIVRAWITLECFIPWNDEYLYAIRVDDGTWHILDAGDPHTGPAYRVLRHEGVGDPQPLDVCKILLCALPGNEDAEDLKLWLIRRGFTVRMECDIHSIPGISRRWKQHILIAMVDQDIQLFDEVIAKARTPLSAIAIRDSVNCIELIEDFPNRYWIVPPTSHDILFAIKKLVYFLSPETKL